MSHLKSLIITESPPEIFLRFLAKCPVLVTLHVQNITKVLPDHFPIRKLFTLRTFYGPYSVLFKIAVGSNLRYLTLHNSRTDVARLTDTLHKLTSLAPDLRGLDISACIPVLDLLPICMSFVSLRQLKILSLDADTRAPSDGVRSFAKRYKLF